MNTQPKTSTAGRRRVRSLLVCLVVFVAAWLGLKLTFKLPALGVRSESTMLDLTTDTRLGRALAASIDARPGLSGIFALADGHDAFAARAWLAAAAERTIDIQYYIWHNDTSGALLFHALRQAADRGVRVRLLLDDNNTVGLDEVLAALDRHPNIEVRLFNPFRRPGRFLGYIVDFPRVNRRMHNKSFTADNQATIVGGRNVADEYFGASPERSFIDLDVLAIGPVVQEVSRDFDRYWASESAYPAERILPAIGAATVSAIEAEAETNERSAAADPFLRAVAERPFVRELMEGSLELEWAPARMVSDDPAKALGLAPDSALLWSRLREVAGVPEAEWRLVSPYFVPMAKGVDALTAPAGSGVHVRVLTNSLAATDVAAVHSGYAKRREALLRGGVELFEMKRGVAAPSVENRAFAGSSGSSLHAKTFSIDGARLFIGSFNFDPRSARLNTELGFVIESRPLAQRFSEAFGANIRRNAFRVRLTDDGSLQWIEQVDGKEIVHDREPQTSRWRRAAVAVLSWLPIDWLL